MKKTLLIVTVTFLAGLTLGAVAVGSKLVLDQRNDNIGFEKASTEPELAHHKSAVSGVSAPASAGADQPIAGDAIETFELAGEVPDATGSVVLTPVSPSWARLEKELLRLKNRVSTLERRIQEVRREQAEEENDAGDQVVIQTNTPEGKKDALMSAGVLPDVADDLVWRQSRNDIERLELRDEAVRDGWFGTERYRKELGALSDGEIRFREELGIEVYDRYLYQTGEPNRVRITSIVQDSAAYLSGLQPGDVIDSYDGELVLDVSALRNATTQGYRDETVPVIIRRGDEVIEVPLPRGPVGVQLEPVSVAPDV